MGVDSLAWNEAVERADVCGQVAGSLWTGLGVLGACPSFAALKY